MSGRGARVALALALAFGLALARASPDGARAQPAAARPDSAYILTGDHLDVRRIDDVSVVHLEGHVVFLSGGTLLFASFGEYTSATGIGRFGGDVEIHHDGLLLLGDEALVYDAQDRIEFPRGVLVVDAGRTVRAGRGTFGLEGSGGELWDDVEVIEEGRDLTCDSLSVVSEEEAYARGRVSLWDRAEKTRVTGALAHLRTGETSVTGDALLVRLDAGGEIETEVRGDTLRFTDAGDVDALGSVRIEREGSIAQGGRAHIADDGDRAVLEESPSLVREGRTITGNRIVMELVGSEARAIVAEGDARLTRDEEIDEEGVIERARDLVTGDTLRLEIESDSLRRAVVWGDVRSTTERRDLSGALLEQNAVRGDTLILETGAGEADLVRVKGGASGTYVPRRDEAGAAADSAAADTALAPIGRAPSDTTLSPGAVAEDSLGAGAPPDSSNVVRYRGDEIEFRTGEKKILLTGNANLRYSGMALDAERVLYDLDRAALDASGDPQLKQGGEEVTGERMGFNIEEQKGIVYEGETTYDNGRLIGGRVVRVDDNTLDVRNGRYTSCDAEVPHYYFSSNRMRVYLDDKSVARPVVFYIREIPLLALPYYMLPLSKKRHSGFLLPAIELGISQSRGRFIRNLGYYWATNDYVDLTGWADIYQNERWTGHLETNYAVRYLLRGNVRGSYSRETAEDLLGSSGRRWDIYATHNQELGERASLTARADFVSDATYRVEQGTSVDDLDRKLKSDVTFQKSWTSQQLSVFASREQELDFGTTRWKIPSLAYSRQRFPILGGSTQRGEAVPWYGTTYVSARVQLANFRDETEIDSLGIDSVAVRFATEESFSLSNSMKIGWLGLSPSADYREALFNKDNDGNTWERRGVWSARASASTNIYGTWRPNLGALSGFRHIVAPSVSFGYSPDFNEYQGQFPSLDGIGGTPRGSQSLGLSMQHTFQMKLRAGEKEIAINDLLIVGQSISRNVRNDTDRAWGDLSTTVRLPQTKLYNVNVSFRHDVYDRLLEGTSIQNQFQIDGSVVRGWMRRAERREPAARDSLTGDWIEIKGLSEGEGENGDTQTEDDSYDEPSILAGQTSGGANSGPWRLSLAHNYSKGGPGSRAAQDIRANLTTRLSRGWYLDYRPYYDLRTRDVIRQDFALVRDLHCWEARFGGLFDSRGWEYSFRINVRAHPDVGYEKGSKFRGFGPLS